MQMVSKISQSMFTRSFLQFACLAGAGWLLDVCILLALSYEGGVGPAYANIISSCVAASLVFIVSRYFIHKEMKGSTVYKTAVYLIYTLVLIFFMSYVMQCVLFGFYYFLSMAHFSEFKMEKQLLVFLAKVVITPPQLICNYFMSRFISQYAKNHQQSG